MSSVSLQSISKNFGSTEVIRNVDLDIQTGEFVVFVGASGSGKSTLLRMIAGLETPTSGSISIGERDVTDAEPAERGVSMVFQSYALYPHMTVRQNISFGLKLAKRNRSTIDDAVQRVADMLQISELLDRKPSQLSGGQRQRVAIARAIVREPSVFLFDEPLSNLDAALRTATRMEIKELHNSLGATMIYVTHDQIEAMSLADRMVILYNGHIEQVGPPVDLYHRPATLYVAQFLGSPTMNIIRADSGLGIKLPDGAGSNARSIGIRPEDIEIGPTGLPAAIKLVEELGETRIGHARLSNGADIAFRTRDLDDTHVGSEVNLVLPTDKLHLFDANGKRIN